MRKQASLAAVIANDFGEAQGDWRSARIGMGVVVFVLTFVVGAITLGSGRTNVMQGAVHLVIFAAFLFLALVP